MADFTVRSDSVSVEQIMDQIRTRIAEKRGIDYTEDEVRRLATVKLETFLDPTKARSDLVERYRRRHQAGPPTADSSQRVDDERRSPPSYDLEAMEIYGSSRGILGRVIKLIRRLLNPILKLFFNPDPIVRVLHVQNQINAHTARQLERGRREVDELCFELLDNLLVEMTRLSIDMKNYKMRLESVASRLDFDERRARALNGRGPDTVSAPGPVAVATPAGATEEGGKDTSAAADTGRRRRRRGRRRPPGGTSVSPTDSAPGPPENSGSVEPETTPPAPDAGGKRRYARTVRLAVVVPRYGVDLSGGTDRHARDVAQRLARHADVEVLTTCALDSVTWQNRFAPGTDRVNNLTVRRFPVLRERNTDEFNRRQLQVFDRPHSIADELAWLESAGPNSPALIKYIRANARTYGYFIFFSYRYYPAYHGISAVSRRAVLVPTAERDPAVGLAIFGPVFRGVRAIMYNSFEERALIHAASGNTTVPGVVVGVGPDVPARPGPARFRRKFGVQGSFAIYVGRIDETKGCKDLFEYFRRYVAKVSGTMSLVLVGTSILPVPSHPRICNLGGVSDVDKFDAMSAADLLIIPSHVESLSIVAIEAWALGKPVVANGRCDVLKGQCIRSDAGLYYENYAEFAEALFTLQTNPRLRAALGAN